MFKPALGCLFRARAMEMKNGRCPFKHPVRRKEGAYAGADSPSRLEDAINAGGTIARVAMTYDGDGCLKCHCPFRTQKTDIRSCGHVVYRPISREFTVSLASTLVTHPSHRRSARALSFPIRPASHPW